MPFGQVIQYVLLSSKIHPKTIFINEADIYQLIFQSKLSLAKEFQKWIFNIVLPQIRKTGTYKPNKIVKANLTFNIQMNMIYIVRLLILSRLNFHMPC